MYPRSEMGESEADADASSHAGSVFSDGLHHTGSGSRHYHYVVVGPPPDALDLHVKLEQQSTDCLHKVLCSWSQDQHVHGMFLYFEGCLLCAVC